LGRREAKGRPGEVAAGEQAVLEGRAMWGAAASRDAWHEWSK
jgi:hypothetical protein